jgi:hypothetical protein
VKNLFLLGFLMATNTIYAETKMVALDMELGYWEVKAEILESDVMNKMLDSMPEEQRAMMQEMMQSKMKIPTTKQCITDDSFKDLEKKMRESMGEQNAEQECKFAVMNSNSKEFTGKLSCKSMEALIQTKVINSKLQESTVESTVAGMGGSKIKLRSEWKSGTCPEGL